MRSVHGIERWFAAGRPNPQRQLRLFCFPYAGGGSWIFEEWWRGLPPFVELCPVELAGRRARCAETPCNDLGTVVADLVHVVGQKADGPFALFGHSMGARLAFELTAALRRAGGPQPVHLFVSGAPGPDRPVSQSPSHTLPDAELVEKIRALNGTPAEVLDSPELLRIALPVLRADLALNNAPPLATGAIVECPITIMTGGDDPSVSVGAASSWARYTTSDSMIITFPGDHFFIHTAREQILETLSAQLTSHVARRVS